MRLRDVLVALGAPARLRLRGWLTLLLYLGACALILGLCGAFALRHEGDAVEALARYLLPESWRVPARFLIDHYLAAQEKEILVNAVVGGSLALVSLLLFPLKEKLSATVEREARLTDGEGEGFPLLVEAAEEVKLFLFFLTCQMSIFWLAYGPDPVLRAVAVALSYLTMAAAFSMDFVTPILQRHGVRFSTAAKTLARRPLAPLVFGAIFSVPASLAGSLVARQASWGLGRTIAVIFAINAVAIAWAAVAGTAAGARVLDRARATRPPGRVARTLAWCLLLGLLGWNLYRFGAVAVALHRKTAILKCSYDVDWKSARLDLPSLGALTGDHLEIGLAVDVTITNPTPRPVVIEDNRLELRHGEAPVAQSSLPTVKVPADGKTTTNAHFKLSVSPSVAMKGRELLHGEGYKLTLWLKVAPGFELPVYLF